MATWFGREANLRVLPWAEWEAIHSESEVEKTWSHIAHSPNCSIAKGQRLIIQQPRYTSFQAVY